MAKQRENFGREKKPHIIQDCTSFSFDWNKNEVTSMVKLKIENESAEHANNRSKTVYHNHHQYHHFQIIESKQQTDTPT